MALQMGKPIAKVQRYTADALASTMDAVHARLSPSSAQLATADDSLQYQHPAQHSTQYPHPWGLPTAAQSSQAFNGTTASAASTQQQRGCRQVPSLSQPAPVAAAPGMHQRHQLQASVVQQQQHAVSGTEAAAASGWAEGWVEGASADQLLHKEPQQQPLAMSGRHSAHHAAGMQPALARESGNPQAAYSADLLPSQQFWNQAAALSGLSQSQSHAADPAVAVRPTAAWFTNPAYTNAPSPMPSPERRPRSHPPPLPHPSQPAAPQPLTGLPQSYASTTYPSLPPSRPGTAQAAIAVPADSNNSWGIGQTEHAAQPASLPAAAQQWQQQQQLASGANAPADAQQHNAGNHQAGVPTFRPTFPSLPPRFTARPQTSAAAAAGTELTAAQHATHQPHAAQAQMLSQRTLHVGSPGPEGSPQQHQAPPLQQWQQPEAQLQQQHSKQQHKQQQPQEQQPQHGQHQQQQQQQYDSSNHEAAMLVKQLQQRVMVAEQDAAVARAEADDRVGTLEARVMLLEGRLKFVEGGLWLD